MLSPLPWFIQKPTPDSKIWRYMDFSKFMDLIHRHMLFFPQANQFDDKYEGAIQNLWYVPPSGRDETFPFVAEYSSPTGPRARHLISCWHQNEVQSAAMWKQYLKSDEGIAIQSTVGNLQAAFDFDQMSNVGDVFIANVSYEPFWEHMNTVPNLNWYDVLFFSKRKSFEYERELRMVVRPKEYEEVNKLGGMYLPVNIDALIERVYIAPDSPAWFFNLVRSVASEKYGLNANLFTKSDLSSGPLY